MSPAFGNGFRTYHQRQTPPVREVSGKAPVRGRRRLWRALIAVAAVIALCWIGLWAYASGYARAGETAKAVVGREGSAVDGVLTFGSPNCDAGVILYPGGLVEADAYAPLAADLAGAGVFVAIPRMPYHLAVFGKNRADAVIGQNGEIGRWFVGGHSLGGAMAASYAAAHPDKVSGVILLAAYSTEPLPMPVLSVYGSADTVLNREKLAANRKNLPQGFTELVIDGGNHAQFGDYGEQAGDSRTSMSAIEQQRIAASAILDFIGYGRGVPGDDVPEPANAAGSARRSDGLS